MSFAIEASFLLSWFFSCLKISVCCLFTWITAWLRIVFLHHTCPHCATVFWHCVLLWRNLRPAWFFHPCRLISFSIWMLESFFLNPWHSMAKLGLSSLSQTFLCGPFFSFQVHVITSNISSGSFAGFSTSSCSSWSIFHVYYLLFSFLMTLVLPILHLCWLSQDFYLCQLTFESHIFWSFCF